MHVAALPVATPPDQGVAQDTLALEGLAGRFVELSGRAGLSMCARLVREAQQGGGLAAWVGERHEGFYPPDWAAAGVDLAALAVVRIAGGRSLWRACDMLLRSGGFSLVVADMPGGLNLPFSVQTRLGGLAQHYHGALVALTPPVRHAAARSSLVSLRAETAKHRAGHDCFVCTAQVVKDKRRAPGWIHEEFRRGTDSLC